MFILHMSTHNTQISNRFRCSINLAKVKKFLRYLS